MTRPTLEQLQAENGEAPVTEADWAEWRRLMCSNDEPVADEPVEARKPGVLSRNLDSRRSYGGRVLAGVAGLVAFGALGWWLLGHNAPTWTVLLALVAMYKATEIIGRNFAMYEDEPSLRKVYERFERAIQ